MMLKKVLWKTISIEGFSFFDLKFNLTCGQAFRWRFYDDDSVIGVFKHRVWQLKQQKKEIKFRVLACPHWNYALSNKFNVGKNSGKRQKLSVDRNRICKCEKEEKYILMDYLQTKVCVDSLYQDWCSKDEKFLSIPSSSKGIRVLRQDPCETLFSFMCSANNSILRIVPMIERMSTQYGQLLIDHDDLKFYDFPKLERLCEKTVEDELRKLGFGYRAGYIMKCANKIIENGGVTWLDSLRSEPYEYALSKLIKLPGIGLKVADCICLMSLDKLNAVPIDTHVLKIAKRDYMYQMSSKSLTHKSYKDVGNFLRTKWGDDYAGWAQAFLFAAEIKPSPKLYQYMGTDTD